MRTAHRIELAPTPTQADYFRRACGTARFVWNWALAEWQRQRGVGLKPTAFSLKKQFNAIKYRDFPWLKEIHRDAHAQPFANLGRAWGRFFDQIKAKLTAHAPVFKRRGACRDAFYVANDKLTLSERKVRLPVIGCVKTKEAFRFGGRILGASVQRCADRWFLSVQVDVEVCWLTQPRRRPAVGVDLNVKGIVCSDGATHATPQPLKKARRRLLLHQRRVSRKIEAAKRQLAMLTALAEPKTEQVRLPLSHNRIKASRKLATCHYRVRCIRQDHLHKTTSIISRENQVVVIEDLQVKNMTSSAAGTVAAPGKKVRQKAGLNGAILDVGFSEFRRQLAYKCERHGTELIVADRWFASSKLCSHCGIKNQALTLKDRHWACAQCGTPHDRDVNASINLERLATGRLESALPEAIGEMTSVRYETGQQDDSGQKPLDREERQRAQICVHFG
jgi:putative transposase